MHMQLPSLPELEKLTLRAVAAYSARCARHGSRVLRGILDERILDLPLEIAEEFASSVKLNPDANVAICSAAAGVCSALSAIPAEKKYAALCLTGLEGVITGVHEAARSLSTKTHSAWSNRQYRRGLQSAFNISKRAATFDLTTTRDT